MADSQREADPGQGEEGPWHPPNQNAAMMAEAAPVPRPQVATFVNGGHMGQGYMAVEGQFDPTSYQDLRPSFSGAFTLSGASQQDLFQAAHSTYGQMTPPPQAGGLAQGEQDDSEAIPAYPSLSSDSAAHIIAASTVDSSSIQQGYLVLDRVVTVQRVLSPADCTVSQSTLSIGGEGGEDQPTTTLLALPSMSTDGTQYVMQVLPGFPSHGEVSTSSSDQDPSVSSLGAAFQRGMMGSVRKVEMECTSSECDTTQSELDCAPHDADAAYLPAVSVARRVTECRDGGGGRGSHSVGMESGGLHTTMLAATATVSPTPAPPPPPPTSSHTSTSAHHTLISPQHHHHLHHHLAPPSSGCLQELHNVAMATLASARLDVATSSTSSSTAGLMVGRRQEEALEDSMVTDSSGLVETPHFSLMVSSSPANSQAAAAVVAAAAAVSSAASVAASSAAATTMESETEEEEEEDIEEEKPSTSGLVMAVSTPSILPPPPPPPLQTRKSSRLAQYQKEELERRATRQQYETRPYSIQELWCEECQAAYVHQCSIHRLTKMEDRVVLSRAWASLPPMLLIYRMNITQHHDDNAVELGVFAKKTIPKLTQFGPFTAEMVSCVDSLTNRNFLLMVEKEDGSRCYFETHDENRCNWMMFVRPARAYSEQNLVAYQLGHDVYFTVIKTIEPRQELKVWYSAPYAERLGFKPHELTEADWALLDPQSSRFQCSACSLRFRTSAALQKHLVDHEREEEALAQEEEEDEEEEEEEESSVVKEEGAEGVDMEEGRGERGRGRRVKGYLLKSRVKQNGETGGFSWRKKTNSALYLNKTRRKYQRGRGSSLADRDRRQAASTASAMMMMKSMYRQRRGRGLEGKKEWVCSVCHLSFDNDKVLNLHTLTHAAENVDGQEETIFRSVLAAVTKGDGGATEVASSGSTVSMETGSDDVGDLEFAVEGREGKEGRGEGMNGNDGLVSLETTLACPMCHVKFDDKQALIHHATEHAKAPRTDRLFKCSYCWKGFSNREKLNKHLLCHGAEDAKPLACDHCHKRFMNNSALACHLKTHSQQKYYTCPVCMQGFDHINLLKQHVNGHKDASGQFSCPVCGSLFEDYNNIRKHMRNFHSDKKYVCSVCDREFPRPDKLKLHMLRHTSHREFMCETCGRQFKRKDKLKEHMKRMHSGEREARPMPTLHRDNPKKFVPKVLPSDYTRFIYKCNTCMLGFKRRGMLVNHLNKRHPGVKPESVHELNLPILKQQKDYYCQHCDKVYKSSSKRKSHILKNHPGAELPASGRKKPVGEEETPGILGSTYSQTVGSVTTMPHSCEFCHKQYASKAKLMQHQRKTHSELVPAVSTRCGSKTSTTADVGKNDFVLNITVADDGSAVTDERYEDVVVATAPGVAIGDSLQQDLLTQAMSELISTHGDFRATGANITVHAPESIQLGRIVTASGPALLQLQPATIELSQLTQAFTAQQFAAHTAQLPAGTTLIATAAPSGAQQTQHVLSAQPLNISMVTGGAAGGQATAIPVSIHGNQATAFVQRSWSGAAATSIQTFHR